MRALLTFLALLLATTGFGAISSPGVKTTNAPFTGAILVTDSAIYYWGVPTNLLATATNAIGFINGFGTNTTIRGLNMPQLTAGFPTFINAQGNLTNSSAISYMLSNSTLLAWFNTPTNRVVFTNDAWLDTVASNRVEVVGDSGVSIVSSNSANKQVFHVTGTGGGGGSATNAIAFLDGKGTNTALYFGPTGEKTNQVFAVTNLTGFAGTLFPTNRARTNNVVTLRFGSTHGLYSGQNAVMTGFSDSMDNAGVAITNNHPYWITYADAGSDVNATATGLGSVAVAFKNRLALVDPRTGTPFLIVRNDPNPRKGIYLGDDAFDEVPNFWSINFRAKDEAGSVQFQEDPSWLWNFAGLGGWAVHHWEFRLFGGSEGSINKTAISNDLNNGQLIWSDAGLNNIWKGTNTAINTALTASSNTYLTALTASRALVLDSNKKIISATGTPDGTKFLRDDGAYAVPSGTSGDAISVNSVSATDANFIASADVIWVLDDAETPDNVQGFFARTDTIGGNPNLAAGGINIGITNIIFEGATQDGFETGIGVIDPTADREIVFQNASGTVAFLSDVVGEANVNGEAAVTNATRLGLVNGKAGVTNLLRSIEPLELLSAINNGTNILLRINSQTLTNLAGTGAATNITSTTLAVAGTVAAPTINFSTNAITTQTADTSPATNDLIVTSDTSAAAAKSVLLNNLPVSHPASTFINLASNALQTAISASSGSTNPVTHAAGSYHVTNSTTHEVTNLLASVGTADLNWLGAPPHTLHAPSVATTYSFANTPSAGGKARDIQLTIMATNTPTVTFPSGINWQGAGPYVLNNFTNRYIFHFDSTNILGYNLQDLTTGVGPSVLQTNAILSKVAVTNATADRVAVFAAASQLTNSAAVSVAELEFLDGVTSAIQTQLTGKQNGQTNANQFGASTTLTLKDGVLVTNHVGYLSATTHGHSFIDTNLSVGGLITVTNNVGYIVKSVAGVGGATTNFTFVIGSGQTYWIDGGTTNVNVVAIMGYDNEVEYPLRIVATNRTATARTFSLGATTNNWINAQLYTGGDPPPYTITNSQALHVTCMVKGTNVTVAAVHAALPTQ